MHLQMCFVHVGRAQLVQSGQTMLDGWPTAHTKWCTPCCGHLTQKWIARCWLRTVYSKKWFGHVEWKWFTATCWVTDSCTKHVVSHRANTAYEKWFIMVDIQSSSPCEAEQRTHAQVFLSCQGERSSLASWCSSMLDRPYCAKVVHQALEYQLVQQNTVDWHVVWTTSTQSGDHSMLVDQHTDNRKWFTMSGLGTNHTKWFAACCPTSVHKKSGSSVCWMERLLFKKWFAML